MYFGRIYYDKQLGRPKRGDLIKVRDGQDVYRVIQLELTGPGDRAVMHPKLPSRWCVPAHLEKCSSSMAATRSDAYVEL